MEVGLVKVVGGEIVIGTLIPPVPRWLDRSVDPIAAIST